MSARKSANLGRLGALSRPAPPRPRNPRVVLLEHLRQMKRVLNEAVDMRHWGRSTTRLWQRPDHPQADEYGWVRLPLPPEQLPENDPDEWAQVRRWAVWLEDAAVRLRHYAEQQERAAYKRRDAALASPEEGNAT